MRFFLNAITGLPHPEERPKGASRRTHGRRYTPLFVARLRFCKAPAFAGITVLMVATITTRADAAEAPAGASSCSGCHAASASVQTPVPALLGRPSGEIVRAMGQFRSGQRQATVMDRIAKGFSDDEIAAIAAWYAALKN